MTYSGTTLNKLCFATISGLTCADKQPLILVLSSSLVLNVVVLAFCFFVIFHRYQYGLFNLYYRRVNGYLIPRPVDSLITTIAVMKFLQIVASTLTLVDWKPTLNATWAVHLISGGLHSIAIVHFIAGIIVYFPPSLTRTTISNKKTSQPFNNTLTNQNSNASSIYSYKAYVPSISILFWFTTFYTVFILGSGIGVGIWVTIVKYEEESEESNKIELFLTVIVMLSCVIVSIICSYYCYAFYRIVNIYNSSLFDNIGNSQSEKNMARDYRDIFMAILSTFLLAISFVMVAELFEDAIAKSLILYMIIIFLEEGLVYNIVYVAMLLIAFRSSKNQIRSLNEAIENSNDYTEVQLSVSEAFDTKTERNSYSSFLPFNPTSDVNAIWHTFIPYEHQLDATSTTSPRTIMTTSDCNHLTFSPMSTFLLRH
ncbi:hypothetical protein BDF19DRAFT_428850 [Syncephalis fuscata]|nr:hypothetical protein BDF19DRAFT_428850 [Syncephalis fuscata]